MRANVLVFFVFLLVTPDVPGENWLNISKDHEDNGYFLDTDSIFYDEGYRYYWIFINFKNRQWHEGIKQGWQSSTVSYRANCDKFKTQKLETISFTEQWGGGEITIPVSETWAQQIREVKKKNKTIWNYPTVDSIDRNILRFVCDYLGN